MSALERAEQAVQDAREAAWREHTLPSIDALVRAVEARCAERLRSEGHHWSGQIAHGLFQGADLIDPNTQEQP